MPTNSRRLVGAFLRERRHALGGATGTHGRGSTLRREDVAARAFISTEYYTRIEQGRFIPSADVLLRIADVLTLDDDQRQYLLDLVNAERPIPTRVAAATETGREDVDPGLARLLTGLEGLPVLVIGAHTAIVGWNAAAAELFVDFAQIPEAQRTCAHLVFTDVEFQRRFVDLVEMQKAVVAILRAGTATWHANREQDRIVAELSSASDVFAERWGNHVVRQPHDSTAMELRHPREGVIAVDRVVLRNVDAPELRIIFFNRRAATVDGEAALPDGR